ncbi:MAG: MotA/TolQ/ExbB proton channel family protein [Nitrospiraceae bacterium]|nr:MotA/TolQ/ExbB proton channel family protein [Nitrospiraceae bacterium]
MFQSGVTGLVGSLGAVSKIVLVLLFVASVISWGVIFLKWKSFRAADREDQRFFSAFTKIRDLDELYRQSKRAEGSPSAQVFQGIMDRVAAPIAGDGVAVHPGAPGKEPTQAIDRQYLDKTVGYLVQNQISQLESYLPVLATTGNITPFIGLLGTVLGIIDSFREIGLQGTASIAAVAPGVSEALVATAAGLFTAIPAVIAYNYFLTRIRKTVFRIESFTVEAMRSLQTRPKTTTVGVQG